VRKVSKKELLAFLKRRYPGDVDDFLQTLYDLKKKYNDDQLFILATILKRILGKSLDEEE